MTIEKTSIKYGILHIPTNLILHAYNEDDNDVELEEDQLLFSSEEEANSFLKLVSIFGLEKKKKASFTTEEKTYIKEYMVPGWTAAGIKFFSCDSLRLQSTRYEDLYVGSNDESFLWTPRDSAKLLAKFDFHDCVHIPYECFVKAQNIDINDNGNSRAQFKKDTGYALSPNDIYLKTEFSTIKVKAEIAVKTPSNKEFKKILFDLVNNDELSADVRNKLKTFIKN